MLIAWMTPTRALKTCWSAVTPTSGWLVPASGPASTDAASSVMLLACIVMLEEMASRGAGSDTADISNDGPPATETKKPFPSNVMRPHGASTDHPSGASRMATFWPAGLPPWSVV